MLFAQHFLLDCQGALVQWFGLAVVPHFPVQQCQIVETLCNKGMLFAQHLLADYQGALVQWFGLAVVPHFLV
jgi:hypothetical protein